eukprot:6466236-Amphidinium_carterae.1
MLSLSSMTGYLEVSQTVSSAVVVKFVAVVSTACVVAAIVCDTYGLVLHMKPKDISCLWLYTKRVFGALRANGVASEQAPMPHNKSVAQATRKRNDYAIKSKARDFWRNVIVKRYF